MDKTPSKEDEKKDEKDKEKNVEEKRDEVIFMNTNKTEMTLCRSKLLCLLPPVCSLA